MWHDNNLNLTNHLMIYCGEFYYQHTFNMPNKKTLLDEIDDDLQSVLDSLEDDSDKETIRDFLSNAYDNLCKLGPYVYQGLNAKDLEKLRNELDIFYGNEDTIDLFINELERVKNSIAQEFSHYSYEIESDDEVDDNTEDEPLHKDRHDYLKNPVTQKKKTGEKAFIELMNYFIFDLDDFQSEVGYVVWYAAIALNLYMHNSTYQPVPGYGKVQKRELVSPLLYYRSQSNHPHRKLHDRFTKESDDTRKISLLPRNPGYVKLFKNAEVSNNWGKEFDKLDSRGFPKPKKAIKDYTCLFFAYCGARTNNLSVYTQAIEHVAHKKKTKPEKIDEVSSQLKQLIPKKVPQKIKQLKQVEVTKRINALLKRFQTLKKATKDNPLTPNLHSKLLKQRNARAKAIKERCEKAKFDHLRVQSTNTGTCLYIDLYPEFTKKIRETSNYSEGFTNVIIGFFGGLLNHHCQQKGLYIHTDRRQSFGFLRPTLTDVGTMRIRLSLGLEPAAFNDIIMQSLKDLDKLLEDFDFTDPKAAAVKACFQACEKPKKKGKVTENTGNYLLAAMRSDKNKLAALSEAQHHLNKEKAKKEDGYLKQAFKKYLDQFIVKNEKEAATESLLTTTKASKKEKDTGSNLNSTVLFDVLKNLATYAIYFASELDEITDDELLLNFQHSYWHSLLKLHNNCDKALYLLAHIDEFEPTHLYAKANLLVENILEYLIVLDSLHLMQKKSQHKTSDPIKELRQSEEEYILATLGIPRKNITVYFTDGGQQAITSALLAMDMQLYKTSKNYFSDKTVYTFSDSYYELGLFLDKVGSLQSFDKKQAKIFFIDITAIDKIKLKELPRAEAVIIDITHCPTMNNKNIKERIQALRDAGIWVVLVSSALKHEELGLDKYQVGKMIYLAPNGKSLASNVKDELDAVMEHAIHPAAASYLKMVKAVLQENNSSLANHFFKTQQASSSHAAPQKSSYPTFD